LADPKRVSPSDEAQHQELYEAYEPQVKGLLAALSFVENYQLLRVFDAQPRGGGSVWRVKVLMGSEARREVEQWEMLAPPGRLGVALWDPGRQHLLPLHPFALFEHCPECSKELYSPPEELFLYQQTKEGQLVYLGLRESLGLTHRMPTREYVDALRILLRVPSWPPGVEVVVGPTPMRPLDWLGIRALAATRSKNLVASYGKEKYQRQVYLQRAEADGHYQAFLQSDRAGFLVVGDSGTGKTNLLCYWVEEALRSQDIVLFYNCADLPAGDKLNVAEVIAEHLGRQRDFSSLLERLDQEQQSTQRQFLLVLDALNEHRAPQVLLKSLCEDVLLQIPEGRYGWFKVVVSCRSEAWVRLERHFTAGGQFYQTADGVEVRLTGFKGEELRGAYGKYQQLYDLKTSFGELSEVARRLVVDPLMMKFVAESYRGQAVPGDVGTSKVFDLYLKEKVGDKEDKNIDRLEKRIVQRLVERMYEEKRDEVAVRSLWGEPEIGQAVLGRESVSSAYFRLLDKGVLTEYEVGGYGAAALWEEAETRVRFTYDRFFEYLLACYLLPREVTVARVKELVEEADKHNFGSLWGAVKTRLIAYAETDRRALIPGGVLAQLAAEDDHKIRGLIVDTLATYGPTKALQVQEFLSQILLDSGSAPAGIVAIVVAYRLKMAAILKSSLQHSLTSVRQSAIQYSYYFWSRFPEDGNALLSWLSQTASQEALKSIPRRVVGKFLGQEAKLAELPCLTSFIGVTFLLSSHLLTNPQAVRRFCQMWLDFYSGFPGWMRDRIVQFIKRYVADEALKIWATGGVVINPATLGNFFIRELGSDLRAKTKECARYMDVRNGPLAGVADLVFELAQVEDGVISLIATGTLINHSAAEPDDTLALLKRMWQEGNTFSKYNVLRALDCYLPKEHDWPAEHIDFFGEAVLDIWTRRQETMNIKSPKVDEAGHFFADEQGHVTWETRTYGLGHLHGPMAMECRKRDRGQLAFVDQLLRRRWDDNPTARIVAIIEALGGVGLTAFSIHEVKPYPVLDTLEQWFDWEGSTAEATEAVQDALAIALAKISMAYPEAVDSVLADYPSIRMRMRERMRSVEGRLAYNQGVWGVVSFMYLPAALPGLIETVERICDEAREVATGLPMLTEYFMDPETIRRVLESIPPDTQ